MHALPNIITERVDDIPLLLEQMQRRSLPTLFDNHCPPHGNWPGLSLGWGSTIWLSAMLSRGDHRRVHGAPWVAQRLWTLRTITGQTVTRVDFTDDRLDLVLRLLRNDTRWAACASALHPHTVRGYALSAARGHVDSTSASAYATGTAGGLCQCGHRKDERPDLPHVKVMQAVLAPLGMPLATDVVSGERADAPRSLPCMARVQASVGRRGLFSVGDGKMASRETRARIAAPGDFSLCPLPQGPLAEGELDAALEAVWSDAHPLNSVVRKGPQGEPELRAEGSESPVPMSQKVDGTVQSWTERRVVGRSVRQAPAAEAALRARVAQAMAQREARNQRGRGKKRLETRAALRQAVVAIGQRDGGENLVGCRVPPHVTPPPGRASRRRPARVEHARHATVEVGVDEAAVEAAVRRLGWRVSGTKQPLAQLSLAHAVVAYRRA